ncbi:MAG: hypothetical protein WC279_14235 [Sulfurimonas sp.]|jgi:hypothetical protein|uniref:hypothetical protein n=1 Tax=Sulfurimonas sp. TaxID=2022749 RepID=UPI00355FB250
MAKFTFKALVDERDLITAKLGTDTVANSGDLNGNDIGKPLKLTAADTYGLCADGDQIDGWLYSVESYTADGYAVGTVQVSGRRRVELSGDSAIGTIVEAAANTARTVAPTNGLGVVSTHTHVTATRKLWRVISGTGLSGDTTCIVEKQ